MGGFVNLSEELVQSRAVFLSFFRCNPLFEHMHAHTLLPSSLHCSSSTLLPAGTLTWSLNLLCFSLLWILVHSACEWRGNELILPASARATVILQTARWGKCNEEAQVFLRWRWPPAFGIGFSLSANQAWRDLSLPQLQVNSMRTDLWKCLTFFLLRLLQALCPLSNPINQNAPFFFLCLSSYPPSVSLSFLCVSILHTITPLSSLPRTREIWMTNLSSQQRLLEGFFHWWWLILSCCVRGR